MEALFRAIGALPRWFTMTGLLLVLILLGVTTYSVTRTILFDCGSINVAGTTLGGHCDTTAFVSTSIWAKRAIPEIGAQGVSTGAASDCEYAVTNSMSRNLPNEGDPADGNSLFNDSGIDRSLDLFWYKLPYKEGLYDLIFLCSKAEALILVTSNASWPANRFLREATARLDTVLATLKAGPAD